MSYINYEHLIERINCAPEKPVFYDGADEANWLKYCINTEPRGEIRRSNAQNKSTLDTTFVSAMYDDKELAESGIHAGMRDIFRFVKTFGNIKQVYPASGGYGENSEIYWQEASNNAQRLCELYSTTEGGNLINKLMQSIFDWLEEQTPKSK